MRLVARQQYEQSTPLQLVVGLNPAQPGINKQHYNVTSKILHHNEYYLTISLTHTHLFNGPSSGTTQVSRYKKGKTNLDFTEARDSEWQWN